MPEKDFAVGAVGIPQVGYVSKKPIYLIKIEGSVGKNKGLAHFICIDKPDLLNGFIQVKGFYSDESEEDIAKNFGDLLSAVPKESILDIYFPWHKIHSIRSLVFNANKPSTLMR